MNSRPVAAPFTERTPRVVAARRLTRRAGRTETGRFLAEGAQAVREALAYGVVHELFVTAAARERNDDLVRAARVPVSDVTEKAAAAMSETVTPQGILAVCDLVDQPVDAALGEHPMLIAVLCGIADPGNAGTVLRVADAAGADAVLFAGDTVDPHNGKCVRASAGSLFHLPVARTRHAAEALAACRAAGLDLIAADGHADDDLDTAADLDRPTAWVFGSEAHGLPPEISSLSDRSLRVPIHGKAESLNLAAAAAVCLYTSASAQRYTRQSGSEHVTRRRPTRPVS
ncbi:MAG TPA: RNA methyltransferase [Pseudonocardiaceae bacterium]|jgi:TrmH family RNA methyltransferase|nr:RNA methyltransferase [Pseudonocardiaceae bacterium]